MSVSRPISRLLQVRALEEERRRLELESSLKQLDKLEQRVLEEVQREKRSLRISIEGAAKGSQVNRIAGLVASRMARDQIGILKQQIGPAAVETEQKREAYLNTRLQRRQVEQIVETARRREAIEERRASQQEMDDLSRRKRSQRGASH